MVVETCLGWGWGRGSHEQGFKSDYCRVCLFFKVGTEAFCFSELSCLMKGICQSDH